MVIPEINGSRILWNAISYQWKRHNLFIIYDFFDQLKKFFQEYPELDENKIYNCDQSVFSIDQTRGHVVSVIGQPTLKLSFGARREMLLYWGYVVPVTLRVIRL